MGDMVAIPVAHDQPCQIDVFVESDSSKSVPALWRMSGSKRPYAVVKIGQSVTAAFWVDRPLVCRDRLARRRMEQPFASRGQAVR